MIGEILAYNEEDLEATRAVFKWLRSTAEARIRTLDRRVSDKSQELANHFRLAAIRIKIAACGETESQHDLRSFNSSSAAR